MKDNLLKGIQKMKEKGAITRMNVLCTSQCAPQITHAEIARRNNISRERVRQILGNTDGNKHQIFCLKCGTGMKQRGNKLHKSLCLACSPLRQAIRIKFECQICGKEYYRKESEIRSLAKLGSYSKYCSKSCRGKWWGSNFGCGAKA